MEPQHVYVWEKADVENLNARMHTFAPDFQEPELENSTYRLVGKIWFAVVPKSLRQM